MPVAIEPEQVPVTTQGPATPAQRSGAMIARRTVGRLSGRGGGPAGPCPRFVKVLPHPEAGPVLRSLVEEVGRRAP